jgi:hypothetical protein
MDVRLFSILLVTATPAIVIAAAPLAINLTVSRADMERALELARWPHTAAERVRFHDQYLVIVDSSASTSGGVSVQQVEVITEFRRLELIAEGHARLNDLFGRSGVREAEDALRPWRGLVAIDAYLRLPDPRMPIPPTDILVDGVGTARAYASHPPVIYAKTGLSPAALQGNTAEAVFSARSVGQRVRRVRVFVNNQELARAAVDFSKLE